MGGGIDRIEGILANSHRRMDINKTTMQQKGKGGSYVDRKLVSLVMFLS